MPHYFDEQQEGPFKPFLLNIKFREEHYKVYSASGVFSLKRLDKGTETLLTYCALPEKGAVLDLGCGYGVVGLILQKLHPELTFTCSDVNERALKLTRMNKKQVGVNVYVKKSNLFEKLTTFDCILTNPPYVAGRKVLFSLIEQAKEHLNPNGTLQLVARHQKGGKMLEKKMLAVFGNVDVLGKKAGFRVYKSINQ